ncbi:hypothetical protein U9M48_000254, partial [Paspalum notatum var. saurae]
PHTRGAGNSGDRGAEDPNPSCSKKSTRRPHPTSRPRELTPARKVWSSSSAPVLAGEPVIIRSDRSHVMVWG